MYQILNRLTAIALFSFVFHLSAHAQETKNVSEFLVGSWIGTVEGETATRLLNIKKATEVNNKLTLESVYGWTSDTNPAPIGIEAIQFDKELKLRFVTGSNSLIDVTQKSEKLFEGTFLLKGASTSKKIQFEKVDEATLVTKIAEQRDPIKKPGVNVPESCSFFSGGWKGKWYSSYDDGDMKLWVASISPDCKVNFLYFPSKTVEAPKAGYRSAEIKDGVLSFICGGGNGTCTFRRKGEEIYSDYISNAGNRITGVFTKIKPN